MDGANHLSSAVKLAALILALLLFLGSGVIFSSLQSSVGNPEIFERYANTLYCAVLALVAIPFFWGLTKYYSSRICWVGFGTTVCTLLTMGIVRDAVAISWWVDALLLSVIFLTFLKLLSALNLSR